MKVHELVASFGRAGESANPMDAAHEILESLREEVEAIENSLGYISGTGGNAGQVFYRSPQITLLKVCFPVGRRTPPHNHGTWATILQLSGEEKNTLYRRENGKLRKVGEMTLTRGAILPMPAETWLNAVAMYRQSACMFMAVTFSFYRAACGIRKR
jgi:predicted metal-dependent enzyme (double-stranded beta helix superfamily)